MKTPKVWTQTAAVDAHQAANSGHVNVTGFKHSTDNATAAVPESSVLPPKHVYKPARKTKGPARGPHGPYKPRKPKVPPPQTTQDSPICPPAWSIGSIDGRPIYGPVPSIPPPSPASYNTLFSPGKPLHSVFSPGNDSLSRSSPVPLQIDEMVSVTPVIELGLQSPASTIGYSDSVSTEMDDDIVELNLDEEVDITSNEEHPLFDKSELLRSLGEKIGEIIPRDTHDSALRPSPGQQQHNKQSVGQFIHVVDENEKEITVNTKASQALGNDESINGVYLPIPTLDDYTVIPCNSSDDSENSPSCSDIDSTLNLEIDQSIIDDIFGLDVEEIDPNFSPKFDRALPREEVPRVESEMIIKSPPIHKDIAPTEKKFFTKDRMQCFEKEKTWKLSRVKTVNEDGQLYIHTNGTNTFQTFVTEKLTNVLDVSRLRLVKPITKVTQQIQR